MIEAEVKNIDGHEVKVMQWPARKAIKNKLKLSKLIGPSIGQLGKILGDITSGDKEDEINLAEVDLNPVGRAIFQFSSDLEDDKADKLFDLILDGTFVNDQLLNEKLMDKLFTADDMFTVYKIMGYAFEVNYKSFFMKSGIGKVLEGFISKTPSRPVSQKTLIRNLNQKS